LHRGPSALGGVEQHYPMQHVRPFGKNVRKAMLPNRHQGTFQLLDILNPQFKRAILSLALRKPLLFQSIAILIRSFYTMNLDPIRVAHVPIRTVHKIARSVCDASSSTHVEGDRLASYHSRVRKEIHPLAR
jgi:hypothetical protein